MGKSIAKELIREEKFKFIVFIDDDEATNFYHEIIVRDSNLCEEYKFYTKPQEALDFFKSMEKDSSLLAPEIIFLDINMPRINGWEFLEKYEKLNISKSSVIIMLSTSSSPKDKSMAQKVKNLHSYINKPLQKKNLIELREELTGST